MYRLIEKVPHSLGYLRIFLVKKKDLVNLENKSEILVKYYRK